MGGASRSLNGDSRGSGFEFSVVEVAGRRLVELEGSMPARSSASMRTEASMLKPSDPCQESMSRAAISSSSP